METAAKNPEHHIDLEKCRYAQSHEGTQVLMEWDLLGFAPLARTLSRAAGGPVLLMYIYDDDFWGYDFYAGDEEDHFSPDPEYFGPITPEERRRLAGNPELLAKWFPVEDASGIERYFIPWNDEDVYELAGAGLAYDGDQFPYGDGWQMTDFAAKLGFPWPFDEAEDAPPPAPSLPTLGEILAQNLPPLQGAPPPGKHPLLDKLPSALSHDYIRRLLAEDGIPAFGFADQTPREIIETVDLHRRSVKRPECDHLCQRLAVLAAFCTFWLDSSDSAWGWLDYATYEPLYGPCEKPTDVYVLRARAALTGSIKQHRAMRDLERLLELDPANGALYQAERKKWKDEERVQLEDTHPYNAAHARQFDEEKRRKRGKQSRGDRMRITVTMGVLSDA